VQIGLASRNFRRQFSQSLGDEFLASSLATARRASRAIRAIQAGDASMEELRRRGSEIRKRTVGALPGSVLDLKASLERRGFHVHYASDAQSARSIIGDILEKRGARTVVKSKSMATEEIHLNQALEHRGISVHETDLGEFIVQLAGEPPAHILAPAVNWSAARVARLFEEKGIVADADRGAEPSDKTYLTKAARRYLRRIFLEADAGITGANFACAREGLLVGVSNEGNLRMCLTLPKLHIAVVPIEKIVGSLEDLAILLPLLTATATGQPLTSYVSFMLGPRSDEESDGPEEAHVVLVDGGRSRIARGPYRDILRCIRCGACLNACPVYTTAGGHAYKAPYMGPIGAVLSTLLDPEHYRELPLASTLCGACSEICPVSIPLDRMLYDLRADPRYSKRSVSAGLLFALWQKTWSRPQRTYSLLSAAQRLGEAAEKVGILRYREHASGAKLAEPAGTGTGSLLRRFFTKLGRSALPIPNPQEPAMQDRRTTCGLHGSKALLFERDFERDPMANIQIASSGEVAQDSNRKSRSENTSAHELAQLFLRNARRNGAEVASGTLEDLENFLGSRLANAGRAVVSGFAPESPELRLIKRLAETHGIGLVSQSPGDAATATVGITAVEAAVAATGTILLVFGRGRPRTPSLLPETHIAIVQTDKVLPDVGSALERLASLSDISGAVFVSGPSKTADIEMTLVTGVHGPGRLAVFVLQTER
jgi:L-lactate dehydrogenase complex protein LldF